MNASIDGGNNIAIGHSALHEMTSGSSNVVIGNDAMQQNRTGSDNTAIGHNALRGSSELGSGNTALGTQAGYSSAGDRNVFIGYRAE